MLSRLFAVVVLLLSSLLPVSAQLNSVTRNLLPVPSSVRWGNGQFVVKRTFTVRITQEDLITRDNGSIRSTTQKLLFSQLTSPTSAFINTRFTETGPADLTIRYGKAGRAELFDEERYSLRVTPMGIALDAPNSLGVLRGLATLRQLVTNAPSGKKSLPEVDILDQPRFPWRGLLVDASRHFMPVSLIKRNLDGMAAVKMNVLHWHLSDDQGFRVETKSLPRLHQVSGQYYTQAQVREVLAYAAKRGIRVLPEFDVPSHTIAWFAAYPELASNDSTYGVYQSWRTSNMAMDPTKESTYALIDTLFKEMTALFPDPYFHIGGDENDGRQWRRSPRIMAYARANNMLKSDGKTLDKHALQTYFNRRVLAIVTKYNKKMVGWDEILGPGLPQNAVIQSWRGKKGLNDAAQAGHATLLSNGYYIDLNYSAATYYAADPLPADTPLTPEQQKLVLGGEATMWAEFADSVVVDSRIWPRTAAVAERLWSPAAATQNVPDMYRRLGVVSAQLEALGLQHRKAPLQLLTQMAGPTYRVPLRTLAEVLEPVKEYKRHFQGFTYTPQTPLNRLVDAAPAESDRARTFGVAVDTLLLYRSTLADKGSPKVRPAKAALTTVRDQLRIWQSNDELLKPLFASAPALTEYAPLSTQLKLLATLGLERLQQLENGQAPTPTWLAAAQKQLEAAKAPAGQAELALLPAMRKLLL
jgi:hexosaminidase